MAGFKGAWHTTGDRQVETDDLTKRAWLALAHVAQGGRVNLLHEHLAGTAQRGSRFAAEFLLDSTRSPPPSVVCCGSCGPVKNIRM